eukprot:4260060-Amphidinium_carterae.1
MVSAVAGEILKDKVKVGAVRQHTHSDDSSREVPSQLSSFCSTLNVRPCTVFMNYLFRHRSCTYSGIAHVSLQQRQSRTQIDFLNGLRA